MIKPDEKSRGLLPLVDRTLVNFRKSEFTIIEETLVILLVAERFSK